MSDETEAVEAVEDDTIIASESEIAAFRAELAKAKAERDEAQAALELVDVFRVGAEQMDLHAAQVADLVRERDEARAKLAEETTSRDEWRDLFEHEQDKREDAEAKLAASEARMASMRDGYCPHGILKGFPANCRDCIALAARTR